jgi:hypothetical protein
MTILPLHGGMIHEVSTRARSHDGPICLITVLVEFYPGDLVALRVKHGVMRRALFARGELAWLLAA